MMDLVQKITEIDPKTFSIQNCSVFKTIRYSELFGIQNYSVFETIRFGKFWEDMERFGETWEDKGIQG